MLTNRSRQAELHTDEKVSTSSTVCDHVSIISCIQYSPVTPFNHFRYSFFKLVIFPAVRNRNIDLTTGHF